MVSGWSDQLGGLIEGLTVHKGCVLFTTVGVGLLAVCVLVRSAPVNWKCTRDKRSRGCTIAKRHDFEKNVNQDHQPREREDVESLMVFWRSAVGADGVECTVVEIHWYSSCSTLPARMRIKPSVVATIVFGVSFIDLGTGGDQ